MTAAEKTRMLAERVMGWEVQKRALDTWVAYGDDGDLVRTFATFEPLTNLAHAGEVLESMVRKGFEFNAQDCGVGEYHVWFRGEGVRALSYAPTIATAICHAALLANGVKEEEL